MMDSFFPTFTPQASFLLLLQCPVSCWTGEGEQACLVSPDHTGKARSRCVQSVLIALHPGKDCFLTFRESRCGKSQGSMWTAHSPDPWWAERSTPSNTELGPQSLRQGRGQREELVCRNGHWSVEKYPGNQRSEKRGLQIRDTSNPRWLQNPWETNAIPRGGNRKGALNKFQQSQHLRCCWIS